MKKYKCLVCGYVHEGNEAPEKCPTCGAGASEFTLIEDNSPKKSKGFLGGKNSNAYIIFYSTVMVVIVAAVLAFAALSLSSLQQENIEAEKKSDLLKTIGVPVEKVAEFNKYITSSFCINEQGQVIEGADAFSVLLSIKEEYEKPMAERQLPLFIGNTDGKVRYIIPVYGSGLWGPIWGYIALENDWSTISGVVFDHKGETPGLGAEITTAAFQHQFVGKTIYSDGKIVGIKVLKGAGASEGNPNAVDAISGGTITSRGVETMIMSCLEGYSKYIDQCRAKMQEAAVNVEEPVSDESTKNQENE